MARSTRIPVELLLRRLAEGAPVDRELLDLALADDRILLTEDKDFGWLVYAARVGDGVQAG